MQTLWITEDDWLCFLFASKTQPKSQSCDKPVQVSDELAERILANQREAVANQKILYDLVPKPKPDDLFAQLPQEAYEQAQDEALIRFAKQNMTNINNPLVKAYWKEVQLNPELLQGDGNGQSND